MDRGSGIYPSDQFMEGPVDHIELLLAGASGTGDVQALLGAPLEITAALSLQRLDLDRLTPEDSGKNEEAAASDGVPALPAFDLPLGIQASVALDVAALNCGAGEAWEGAFVHLWPKVHTYIRKEPFSRRDAVKIVVFFYVRSGAVR